MLSFEAVFTNIFYSAFPTCMDGLRIDFMPWSLDAVSWLPLNSHSPFRDACTGDLALTADELLQHEEDRKRRMKQHFKTAYAKNAQRTREQYDLDRAQHRCFPCKKRAQAVSWTARNKHRVKSHYVKNNDAQVNRTNCSLSCHHAFLLTGTPIFNTWHDLMGRFS
jgi:hypothetical protein